MRSYFVALLASVGMVGCAAHPLPEQSTGFDTVQIVAKVRCELRDGLRSYLLGALYRAADIGTFPRGKELADRLENGDLDWLRLRSHLKSYGVDPTTMRVFERYNGGAIAYEFLFNMTENNKHTGGVDLLRLYSRGALSAGVSAGGTFDRNNQRNFANADTFEKLLTLFDKEYCGPGSDNGTEPVHRQVPNLAYPVAGALGLRELVGAFLNLNQSGNLVGLPSAPATAAMLPTISESMKFTTTFTGGGSVGFAAANDTRRILRLDKASFSTTHTREDIHTLRIVIKLPLESEKETRTIAEQRLLDLGNVVRRGSKTSELIKAAALADLSLAPGKEYIEQRIDVARSARVLLPE